MFCKAVLVTSRLIYLYALFPSKVCLDSCRGKKKNLSALQWHVVYVDIVLLLSQSQAAYREGYEIITLFKDSKLDIKLWNDWQYLEQKRQHHSKIKGKNTTTTTSKNVWNLLLAYLFFFIQGNQYLSFFLSSSVLNLLNKTYWS